jgi:hypothetical protein
MACELLVQQLEHFYFVWLGYIYQSLMLVLLLLLLLLLCSTGATKLI